MNQEIKEPDVDNDEFQCEACDKIFDIEDSVKFQGAYLCPPCSIDVLKQTVENVEDDPTSFAILTVRTDWDFSVMFKEKLFNDFEFKIKIDFPEQLKTMQLKGPFGIDAEPEKRWEWDQAMQHILADPTKNYSNLGGNRGVEWYVF